MILSNTAIFEALDDGRLVIDPEPAPRVTQQQGPKSPFGTSAVDLQLGPDLVKPKHVPHAVIDLGRRGDVSDTLSAFTEPVPFDGDSYELEPGPDNFILGQTLEFVRLPLPSELDGPGRERPALAARIEGKSSRARFGLLVHFTAPTIHAGWSGRITLEMMCLGQTPLKLYPGLLICQLIVEEVVGDPTENESEFQDQMKPTGG